VGSAQWPRASARSAPGHSLVTAPRSRPSRLDGAAAAATAPVSLWDNAGQGRGGRSSLRWHRGVGAEIWSGAPAVFMVTMLRCGSAAGFEPYSSGKVGGG
jgi:hypothetical protein